MKIQVKNLGILNEVEIDLKPMTIFVGLNNSGKTLLAYVLLAIFGQTADLSLLFTTHSPYVVDHLVNLMRAYEHEDKELIKEEFYLQQTEAFISKDNVAVYLFEDGAAKNILGEDGGIQ